MSSSLQLIDKQTGTVKNLAPQGILSYININKRKISSQKASSTEKKMTKSPIENQENLRKGGVHETKVVFNTEEHYHKVSNPKSKVCKFYNSAESMGVIEALEKLGYIIKTYLIYLVKISNLNQCFWLN